METIAIYWEPVIKTYGIDVERGLCLLSAAVDASEVLETGGGRFSEAALPGKVLMVSATPAGDGRMLLQCVTTSPSEGPSAGAPPGWPPGAEVTRGVELLHFHGPHYGDRYGIAVAAFNALAAHGVPVLSAACSGASVYIVVPRGRGGDARSALSTAFAVPTQEESSPAR